MKYIVTLNDKRYEVDVTETDAVITGVSAVSAPVPAAPQTQQPREETVPAPAANAPAEGTQIKAPMPGTIIDVKVSVGQPVKAGDVLFILEAMKMENEVAAPADGTVKQILTPKGSAVQTDTVLAVI